ncbi:MAG: Mpo1-like protein, partial [Ginsengibacter sp.]
MEKKYHSFWSFYPYYLTEHKNPVSRALHFTGTLLIFVC